MNLSRRLTTATATTSLGQKAAAGIEQRVHTLGGLVLGLTLVPLVASVLEGALQSLRMLRIIHGSACGCSMPVAD